MLKITPKKPPRKKPPQSSAMVKIDGLDNKDDTSLNDVFETTTTTVGELNLRE